MKQITLSLIFSLIFNQAQAMEVWITTPQPVSAEKMQNIIKNLPTEMKDAEVRSFTEVELRNPLSIKAREKIEKLMGQAQDEELHRNYGLAIKLNEQVLLEIEKYPNILGLQNITFSVFVKTAQLYDIIQDSEKAESFWQKAYAWNSKGELVEELYPSSVIKKFKKLKAHSEPTQIKIKAPLQSAVFFDGKKINGATSLFSTQTLTGKHQIAVLISGNLWQVENIRLKKASAKPLVFDFKSYPVVSGNCDKPELNTLKLPPQTRLMVVFEKENCNRVYDGEAWYSVEGQRVDSSPAPSGKMIAQMSGPQSQNWFTKMTKSPWFWVGVSAVAVGSLIYVRNQQVTPTVSTGMQ